MRRIDSDEEDASPCAKKPRLSGVSSAAEVKKTPKSPSVSNVLNTDFDEEPPEELVEGFLETLTGLYPSYDKMVR